MKAHERITREFLAAQHAEGEIIETAYFWDLFGLIQPKGRVDIKEADRAKMRFASYLTHLVRVLLIEHKQDLQNVYGAGYRLVPYQERIRASAKDFKKNLSRELNKTKDRLTNIPHPENLSYDDQRHRDYVLQLTAAMRRELRSVPRYPK